MVSRREALAGLGLAGAASAAWADDYRPAVCRARAAYAGAPLRRPVSLDPVGPISRDPFAPSVAAGLDEAFGKVLAATGPGSISAAVMAPGRGAWSRTETSGGQPLLWWASAGKTFVAAAVMQLVEAGRLSLDDPLSRWRRDAPNADLVSVRDLLSHTSGLFSANEDRKARALRRALSIDEHVRIAARHGAMACPGERWRYSNTGYALLGEILQAVEGRSWPETIRERIIAPLGLERTVVVGTAGLAAIAPPLSAKGDVVAPDWAGAAGPIAAPASDMIGFWAGLLGERLLRPETVQAMLTVLYPMFDAGAYYGLGVMALDVPQPGGGSTLWLGHVGGAPGTSAVAIYAPAKQAFAAAALTGDGSATATVNLLLSRV